MHLQLEMQRDLLVEELLHLSTSGVESIRRMFRRVETCVDTMISIYIEFSHDIYIQHVYSYIVMYIYIYVYI